MNSHITIQKQGNFSHLPTDEQLKAFITAALLHPDENTEITLRIVDEIESQQLNFNYRQKNKSTNVLAFPYETPGFLGDLVVCAPLVAKEAAEQDKTLLAHWAHLLIHGTLHLQGYDHIEEVDRLAMEKMEIKCLQELDFTNPYDEELSDE